MNEIISVGAGLLIAHVLTDFFIQTQKMVERKRRTGVKSGFLLIHALTAGMLAVLFTWRWNDWLLVGMGTAVSHWFIDGLKIWIGNFAIKGFVADQVAHMLVVLLIIVLLFPEASASVVDISTTLPLLLITLLGLLLLYRPTSFFIQIIINQWNMTEVSSKDTLPHAGKWIGYLERTLIFVFIMINEYSAIGFLIAAKSILRFRDHENQQMMTEYILLGTLISFTSAILISLFTHYLLGIFLN